MVRFFLTSLLFVGALASCAPRQQAVAGVTVTPVLIKLSESAPRGGTLTIQGRYLGGPATGRVRLGADATGTGGYVFPASAVRSWTDNEIVLTLPGDAPVGGSWLFVEVGGRQSTGLPYSVRQ
ncbi:cell surface receptor IPT/TIG [Deinococcus geothermalis DSM 11300]|uniref:Cell surface receptor IPT/TIG n=1 Tax=Deinococcus geothermalis (strain DSM 11300 / CIP 105573 / AG-3a) TaxID=319795 RepID=Q1IZB7_DEIGD|nr:IPT/TIG domain-containing protein [Deinococcus geothermalis]ABF45417.1 cell surface receptor IPT/TIG [Deinococcus geothermalis DSM 11300]